MASRRTKSVTAKRATKGTRSEARVIGLVKARTVFQQEIDASALGDRDRRRASALLDLVLDVIVASAPRPGDLGRLARAFRAAETSDEAARVIMVQLCVAALAAWRGTDDPEQRANVAGNLRSSLARDVDMAFLALSDATLAHVLGNRRLKGTGAAAKLCADAAVTGYARERFESGKRKSALVFQGTSEKHFGSAVRKMRKS